MSKDGNGNNRIITICKSATDNKCKDNYYAKINNNAIDYALSNLHNSQLALWLYYAKNMPSYEFTMSSKHLNDKNIMCRSSYSNAFKALEEKGFLVKLWERDTVEKYRFYDYPRTKEEIAEIKAEARQKEEKRLEQNLHKSLENIEKEASIKRDEQLLYKSENEKIALEQNLHKGDEQLLHRDMSKDCTTNTIDTINNITKEKKEKVEVVKEVKQEPVKKETPVLKLAFFPAEDRVSDPELIQSLIDDTRY